MDCCDRPTRAPDPAKCGRIAPKITGLGRRWPDRLHHVPGAIHQVGPGEAQDGPPGCHEIVLPVSVPLEGLRVAVERTSIDLHREQLRGEGEVQLVPPRSRSDPVIRDPPCDPRIAQKGDRAPLSLGVRSVGKVPDDFAELASPAVSGEPRMCHHEVRERDRSPDQAPMGDLEGVGGRPEPNEVDKGVCRSADRDPSGPHDADSGMDHDAGLDRACSRADQPRFGAPIEAVPRPTAQEGGRRRAGWDGVGVDQKGGPCHRAQVQGGARKGQDLGVDPDEHALGHPSVQRPIGNAPLSELATRRQTVVLPHRTDARRPCPRGHPSRVPHPPRSVHDSSTGGPRDLGLGSATCGRSGARVGRLATQGTTRPPGAPRWAHAGDCRGDPGGA